MEWCGLGSGLHYSFQAIGTVYGQSCMMCQSDTGAMYRDEGGWDFWPCVYVVNYSQRVN